MQHVEALVSAVSPSRIGFAGKANVASLFEIAIGENALPQ